MARPRSGSGAASTIGFQPKGSAARSCTMISTFATWLASGRAGSSRVSSPSAR